MRDLINLVGEANSPMPPQTEDAFAVTYMHHGQRNILLHTIRHSMTGAEVELEILQKKAKRDTYLIDLQIVPVKVTF